MKASCRLSARSQGSSLTTGVDGGGGVMISTGVFQDQASAEESNRRAADYVRQNLVSVFPNPPQITAGEVVAYKAK